MDHLPFPIKLILAAALVATLVDVILRSLEGRNVTADNRALGYESPLCHVNQLVDSPSPDALEVERAIHAELHRRGLSAQVRTDATFAMLRVRITDVMTPPEVTDHEQHPNVTEIDPAHALAYLNEGTTFTLAGEAFDTRRAAFTVETLDSAPAMKAFC
jgi:hypothetical protein